MVLGTDMKQHFSNCLIFSGKVSEAEGKARGVAEAGEVLTYGTNNTKAGSRDSPVLNHSSAELGSDRASGCGSVASRSSMPRLMQLNESTPLLMELPPPPRRQGFDAPATAGASSRRSFQKDMRTRSDMSHDRYRRASLLLAIGTSLLKPASALTAATKDPTGRRLTENSEVALSHSANNTRKETSSQCISIQQADPFLASAIGQLTLDDTDRLLVWKVRCV